MHRYYEDIISRIKESPTWFDENGVPRYGEFSPNMIASIYAPEAVLAEIACQSCRTKFSAAFSHINVQTNLLKDVIADRSIHYGDPPNMWCCEFGLASGAITLKILQYWKRNIDDASKDGWTRDGSLEIEIDNLDD